MIKFSEEKRKKILEDWQKLLLANYPVEPVIEITDYIEECTKALLGFVEAYYEGREVDVDEAVDDLMRFLATDKNLTPGESIAQLLHLKKLLLKTFPDMTIDDFVKISNAIDSLACKAFNKYMEAREHIYSLRVKEKDKTIEMMRKAMDLYEQYYGHLSLEP
ncbi:RsbRD N-terminal domain-containing protein [Archaeoglobus veneficus]|uniref:RsbT co-antagonist protein RsbRD N-terminal domain-containing protein n=1 Tax=Archaeoglobus veneficus (strain DSM 11195 / SNP6) TaxID=693661 RepID=F2KNM6_ARCVS|nr:RsbRD N-terminal domain-containing protein [Archaeoglobus veneficus]AEA46254.1 hypothetical protein Arcve_0217 [Archaeoglobus veneficus SNP6]